MLWLRGTPVEVNVGQRDKSVNEKLSFVLCRHRNSIRIRVGKEIEKVVCLRTRRLQSIDNQDDLIAATAYGVY